MALTKQDIQKITAVVHARADLQDAKIERLRAEMATKEDLSDMETRLTEKLASKDQVEQIKEMLTDDIHVLGGDVRTLKRRIKTRVVASNAPSNSGRR